MAGPLKEFSSSPIQADFVFTASEAFKQMPSRQFWDVPRPVARNTGCSMSEVGQERSQSGGGELIAVDDAGGPVAAKCFVPVLVLPAQGEGGDLSCQVGVELFLTGGPVNRKVETELRVTEADELEGNDVRPLVQEGFRRPS